MRESRNAQLSIFDFYSKHEQAKLLKALSDELDRHPDILLLIKLDLDKKDVAHTGACGLCLESVFRCLFRLNL